MSKIDRGFVQASIVYNQSLSLSQCKIQLQDLDASKRCIAAFHLAAYINQDVAKIILEHLLHEKQLYVRIALCDTLSHGDEAVALIMFSYLTKLGNNQIHALPQRPSLKKSYPLPRDLIARTLAHMPSSINVSLFFKQENIELMVLREFIDALGSSLFYQPLDMPIMKEVFAKLLAYKALYEDAILTWKIIQSACAFPNAYAWLVEMKNSEIVLYREEAQRSITFLAQGR